jgi:hypothetical protein
VRELLRPIAQVLRSAGRILLWPFLWFVDRQFRWLSARLSGHMLAHEERMNCRLVEIERRLADHFQGEEATFATHAGLQTGVADRIGSFDVRLTEITDLARHTMRLAETAVSALAQHDQRLREIADFARHNAKLGETTVGAISQHDSLLGDMARRIAALASLEHSLLADAEIAAELNAIQSRLIARLEDRLAAENDGATSAAIGGLKGRLAGQAEATLSALTGQAQTLAMLADRSNTLVHNLTAVQGTLETHAAGTAASLSAQEQTLAQVLAQATAAAALTSDLGAKTFVNRSIAELGDGAAELLNYATWAHGFASQVGLWINHPLWVEHRKGEVAVIGVNERIVEIPYVLEALADLPVGSHILDFGATESTLALSLASMGQDVVALDLRPYPLEHPRLTVVTCRAEEWDGPDHPFDAIVSLSTLEHVGLGHYENGHGKGCPDLDRKILERFRGWLRPGGLLILTAPYGRWSVDDFQRTYDRKHLRALLAGWEILDQRYAVSSDPLHWCTMTDEPPSSTWDVATRGVILLRATPPTND